MKDNYMNLCKVKIRIATLIIVIFSVSICIGCSENDDLSSPRRLEPCIFGYAFLDNAETHEGIFIRIIQTGDSTFTNANGRYQFSQLEPDTYTVVATYDEYEPAFAIIYFAGIHNYKIQDLQLSRLSCTPKDSLPYGYPLGVRFCEDISFVESATSYFAGDSLFISAWEYYLPPFQKINETTYTDTYDVLLISSLGDKEVKHVDRYLGSIPEIWRFGYIIDSSPLTKPKNYNGVIEIEPSGGWVIAMYQSYWLKKFICKSIEMNPSP